MKTLTRALGEIVIVTIGILIAFSLSRAEAVLAQIESQLR